MEAPRLSGSCPPRSGRDTYEEVRLSFFARLRGEAGNLAALSRALADGPHHPAAVLSDIREFAHRLRGAAAVFEEPALSSAAKVLELAAMDAATAPVDRHDPAIIAAMRALAAQLARLAPEPQG
jgi:HPt (histidine-containing phosphotransfer) domain-containing protein